MIAFPSSTPSPPRPILRHRRTRSNLRSAPSAITPSLAVRVRLPRVFHCLLSETDGEETLSQGYVLSLLYPFPRFFCSTLYPSRRGRRHCYRHAPPPSTPSFSPSSRSRNELNGVRPKERLDQEKQDIDSYRGKPVFPFSSFSFLSPFFLFSFLSFLRTFLLSFFLSSSPSFLLFFFRCPLLQPLYESESILDPPFLSPVAATYLPQDAARIYWPRRSHLSISPPLKSLQINPVD